MSLDCQAVRKRSIEGILKLVVDLNEEFQTSPLHYQRMYAEDHQNQMDEWLAKLKPYGIETTSVFYALEQYEDLKRSWKAEAMRHRADLEAKFYDFLVAEEKAELDACRQRENIMGKVESEYSLQQKAEVRRIQNRWAHLKSKGVG